MGKHTISVGTENDKYVFGFIVKKYLMELVIYSNPTNHIFGSLGGGTQNDVRVWNGVCSKINGTSNKL